MGDGLPGIRLRTARADSGPDCRLEVPAVVIGGAAVDPGTGSSPAGRRGRILQLLRESTAPRSIQSLADELGVHVNTVRFHLDALVGSGRVEQVAVDPVGPGRPPALFRATHRMDPAGPTNYRLLATMLTGYLVSNSPDPTAAALDVGRAWGPRLLGLQASPRSRVGKSAAVRRLIAVLGELGFEPEPPSSGPGNSSIRLRHCPFLDLVAAEENLAGAGENRTGRVICSLHLGLMQGALDAMGSPVAVDRLDPFAEPDLCVAHLGPVRPGSETSATDP
jgi:predicted ArsR family transcriptional regulator